MDCAWIGVQKIKQMSERFCTWEKHTQVPPIPDSVASCWQNSSCMGQICTQAKTINKNSAICRGRSCSGHVPTFQCQSTMVRFNSLPAMEFMSITYSCITPQHSAQVSDTCILLLHNSKGKKSSTHELTSALRQRKGRAPLPSVTLSCHEGGGGSASGEGAPPWQWQRRRRCDSIRLRLRRAWPKKVRIWRLVSITYWLTRPQADIEISSTKVRSFYVSTFRSPEMSKRRYCSVQNVSEGVNSFIT